MFAEGTRILSHLCAPRGMQKKGQRAVHDRAWAGIKSQRSRSCIPRGSWYPGLQGLVLICPAPSLAPNKGAEWWYIRLAGFESGWKSFVDSLLWWKIGVWTKVRNFMESVWKNQCILNVFFLGKPVVLAENQMVLLTVFSWSNPTNHYPSPPKREHLEKNCQKTFRFW